jgi:hypothetical protein
MKAVLLSVLIGLVGIESPGLEARQPTFAHQSAVAMESGAPSLESAHWLFYVGRYEEAAGMAEGLRVSQPDDLANYELRTSALHFLIKRNMGDAPDKDDAFKRCAPCPALLADLLADTARAQTLAHARLKESETDQKALFFLGKIDLTYIWLNVGTLGQRTGWGEYWEARHSLDAVLQADPEHVRARVARAWIDYIVDTKVPRGLRWMVGGGNRKRALITAREASEADTDFFSRTEARFSLWEMLIRERQFTEAVQVAERLVEDFPQNAELSRFIASNRARATD